jgi:thiol-disulfide isomerase/thioredoxin
MSFSLASITQFAITNKYRIGIFFIILLIGFGVWQFAQNAFGTTAESESFTENAERVSDANGNEPTANVMFFYADWCPHCKTAKPVWEEISTEYTNKVINGYRVTFSSIDCSEKSEDTIKMMDAYDVEGYPTIKLIKDGQTIDFDAKPTRENLSQFLNTAI